MSTLEKNIYKRINLPANSSPGQPVESRAYRGFSTVDPSSKSWVLYDISLIKQDIVNHFSIRQGEKLSDPEFGTIIWDVLFEPLTQEIRELIIQDISEIANYDPRVQVDSVTVDTYDNGIQIDLRLTYLTYSISEQLQVRFDRDTGIAL
jgi:phage baseplate assembly protein W